MKSEIKIISYILIVAGLFVILFQLLFSDKPDSITPFIIGSLLIFLPFLQLTGRSITKFVTSFGSGKIVVETESMGLMESVQVEPPRELDEHTLTIRRDFSSKIEETLPGVHAPAFNVLEEKIALTVTPCSDPMTPMYMLDNNFRIINWNISFSICFDRTMEGRKGLNVLEWTYFLENYQEVLDHGVKAFADPNNFPTIDVEQLEYQSRRFGYIKGIKRAYQIPNDDGTCLGWLITIEPEFETLEMSQKFQATLFNSLRLALMWSEYALSYDIVLNQSDIYPHLIQKLIGEADIGPKPIPFNTKVLDLGAGTGNITSRLASPEAGRLIVSIDNNQVMLNHLRSKCKQVIRHDAQGPGVIPIKQDISSLFGLSDGFFDVVVVNNVLYSLPVESVQSCLKEIFRVLKPDGEIRLSEPHKKANVKEVLAVIKKELQTKGHFEEIEDHYNKVEQINNYSLAPMLNKVNLSDMENTLKQIGFSQISYSEDKTYAGQSFIVCAIKS